jgi:putative endonuclease
MAEGPLFSSQDRRPITAFSSWVGQTGEAVAAEFLEANGYRIVMSNFTVPVGRNRNGAEITGEIDLIALDGDTLCFIEIKTRSSVGLITPDKAVDLRKQRQITRTARIYKQLFEVDDVPHRYDVVSVVLDGIDDPVIELHRAFWTDAKFAKRRWDDGMW